MSETTISDVGEFELIARLTALLGASSAIVGIGDDTAVLEYGPDKYLLATTDMLVEGVHFSFSKATAHDIGRRAIAVNVSDIAAMGGLPHSALLSLAAPARTLLSTVEDMYRGIRQEADLYGVSVVGGNTTSTSGPLSLDVCVLGEVAKQEVVLRSGAQPGDVLAVTGALGGYAARRMAHDQQTNAGAGWDSVPRARVKAGRCLASQRLVHAMMDLSDGLGGDIHHLASASGVGAVIYEEHVPISISARSAVPPASGQTFLELALFGGEDYELLFALPQDAVADAKIALGNTPLYVVGTVLHPEHGVVLERFGGKREPLPASGWTHF